MSPSSGPALPTFWQASTYWLRLGLVSFGGPAGQIALMHEELVVRRRWISERRFLHALNYCMVLPGPEAQQLATYIGWLMHRTGGGLVAGGLFVLPSLFMLIGLSWIYLAYGSVPFVVGLFYGIKPAVTAIVVSAAWRIGSRALTTPWLWCLAAAAFTAIFAFNIPFPVIVVSAAAIGYVGARLLPEAFGASAAHPSVADGRTPTLIDDDTPLPQHACFSLARCARVTAVGVGLWTAASVALVVLFGWDGLLPQMGWFFTKAALLTFGGAYAVLPYVVQGAVEQHQWLTAAQMIDGLALGETTPGPLIMVVAYVGFVGGWAASIFGPESPVLSGAAAAMVVTFFTFLPSFLFIFVGGPLIEGTRGNLTFTAPLTAVTAAVVGVIVDLAAFFGYHVCWPHGLSGPFDAWSATIAGVAAVALLRFRIGVIPVVGAAGLAGLLVKGLA